MARVHRDRRRGLRVGAGGGVVAAAVIDGDAPTGDVAANVFYATLYTLIPNSINGSTGFLDNFFFSVQTWATIGYGGMTPKGTLANMVVVVESMTGIFGVALLTGLFFAKFARPEARVLFAKKATISMYNGKPTLMIRLANERGSHIVEAEAHVTVIRDELSPEGQRMRRIHDVQLARSTQPLFRLSWTVMHVIDERSPFYGYDVERFTKEGPRLFINLMGYDASVGQTAHASSGYGVDDILFGARYKDATRDDGKRMVLDFALFHETEPAPLPSGPLGVPPAPPSPQP
jgi:inward rectifier potassium channel